MSRITIRWVTALAAVVILLTPASALHAQTSAPCATVSVSLSPAVASRGDLVTVAAAIANCSATRQRYTIKYELTTPCTSPLRFSVPFRFNAGQQISAGFSFRIPFFTCSGDYTVTISVFSGTTLLASSTASLTVN